MAAAGPLPPSVAGCRQNLSPQISVGSNFLAYLVLQDIFDLFWLRLSSPISSLVSRVSCLISRIMCLVSRVSGLPVSCLVSRVLCLVIRVSFLVPPVSCLLSLLSCPVSSVLCLVSLPLLSYILSLLLFRSAYLSPWQVGTVEARPMMSPHLPGPAPYPKIGFGYATSFSARNPGTTPRDATVRLGGSVPVSSLKAGLCFGPRILDPELGPLAAFGCAVCVFFFCLSAAMGATCCLICVLWRLPLLLPRARLLP